MSSQPKGRPIKLLPHQAAFVDVFFSPSSKRVIELRGEPGLGKHTTLVALSCRLLQERPTARTLFLVHAALRLQFVEMLRNAGCPALLVDRYRFREMLDSATEGELWPPGIVAVLSREFAKQPDIQESLAAAHWDLLIADEAHSFGGVRAGETIRRIGASAERVILATLPDLELPDAFRAEDASVVEWRGDQVVDQDGRPLDAAPRPILHEMCFDLFPFELDLSTTVSDLSRILEVGVPQRFTATTLFRALRSSPAALEGMLRRLVARSEARGSMDASSETAEEEMLEDAPAGQMDRPTAETVVELAGRALQEIEAMGGDSKLEVFSRLMSRLNGAKMPSRRICVLTDYVGTLYYLAAEIEGRDVACQLLHGGMKAEERARSLTPFSSAGGILVATRGALTEGLTLREVTDLVLYDVPGSKIALQEVLGRFDRLGRLTPLNVHVLVPSNDPNGLIAAHIGLLRDFFAVQATP